METDNILGILSSEGKNADDTDENKTAVGVVEGETIHLKYLEQKWETENKLLIEKLEGQRQDRDQRKEFAMKIFVSVSFYMVGVFLVLVLSGWKGIKFGMSDPVLITLLGTTTATVIGVFNFVARYLFHSK